MRRWRRRRNFADRSARIAHIVDNETILASHVTDNIHHVGLIRPFAAFVAKSEAGIEAFRICPSAFGTAGVGCDDDQILDRILTKIFDYDRGGIQVIDRNIKKPLYLGRVQIDRQYSLRTGGREQVCHQFRGDRHAWPIFFVSTGVTEIRNNRGDAFGRCSHKSVDHYQQFHQIAVARRTCRLNYKHIRAPNVFTDLKIEFAIRKSFRARLSEIAVQNSAYLLRKAAVRIARKYFDVASYAHKVRVMPLGVQPQTNHA